MHLKNIFGRGLKARLRILTFANKGYMVMAKYIAKDFEHPIRGESKHIGA